MNTVQYLNIAMLHNDVLPADIKKDIWPTMTRESNSELDRLINEEDIVRFIKARRIR